MRVRSPLKTTEKAQENKFQENAVVLIVLNGTTGQLLSAHFRFALAFFLHAFY